MFSTPDQNFCCVESLVGTFFCGVFFLLCQTFFHSILTACCSVKLNYTQKVNFCIHFILQLCSAVSQVSGAEPRRKEIETISKPSIMVKSSASTPNVIKIPVSIAKRIQVVVKFMFLVILSLLLYVLTTTSFETQN